MTRQNKENFGYLKFQNVVGERACNGEINSAGTKTRCSSTEEWIPSGLGDAPKGREEVKERYRDMALYEISLVSCSQEFRCISDAG